MKTTLKLLLLSCLAFGLASCSDLFDSGSDSNPTSATSTKSEVIETYANIVLAGYEDSLNTAEALKEAIEALIANPSETTLDAAKEAWLAARIPYGQTEGFRFASGPIDDDDTGPEGQLNAWPLDENYIDYVDTDSDAGIINDPENYPSINADVLIGANELVTDKTISTGYHAIEFLLWGQDTTVGAGAGTRAYTDYLTDGNGTNDNQDRRGEYLSVVIDILIDDLQFLVDEWSEGTNGNYRETFLSMDQDQALSNILTGIGTLSASELAVERMETPLELRIREGEHSCFSDNTHIDVIMNAKSIQNVYLGSYTRVNDSVVSGTGIFDLLSETNTTLANQLKTEMETTMTAVNAIQTPFDQELLASNAAGNTRVLTAVDALKEQGDTIVDAAVALGLSINIE